MAGDRLPQRGNSFLQVYRPARAGRLDRAGQALGDVVAARLAAESSRRTRSAERS